MLFINGIIALIGIITATIVVNVKIYFGLTGIPLILVCFLGLWVYLFLSDVVEDYIIEKFNAEAP